MSKNNLRNAKIFRTTIGKSNLQSLPAQILYVLLLGPLSREKNRDLNFRDR